MHHCICILNESAPSPLQKALYDLDSTSDDIKLLLEQDASAVNKLDVCGNGPLHHVLRYPKRSAVIVKLLLDYGDRNNLVNREEKGDSPLFIALRYNAEVDVINVLLSKGADLHKMRQDGRSPLCFALGYSKKTEVIKLLLEMGAYRCECHKDPLYCYIQESNYLKADVIKLLLGPEQAFNKFRDGNSLLHSFLLCNKYEMEAIKLLLNHKNADIHIINQRNLSLLHLAVVHNSKLSVIKYLIEQGAQVDTIDNSGYLPLHEALSISDYQPGIIKLLIEKGSNVNQNTKLNDTPLSLAIEGECKLDVVKYLLAAGAHVTLADQEFHILTQALRKYDDRRCKENLARFHLLLKYTFLTCPDFSIESLIWGHQDFGVLSRFTRMCLREIQSMKLKNVGHVLTLYELVGGKSGIQPTTPECKHEMKVPDFNQLLKALANNTFPVYFEVISAKITRSFMEKKIREQPIYTEINNSDEPHVKRKVILDYTSVYNVAEYLSDVNLLSLILAFYNLEYTTCGPSKEVELQVKRSTEESALFVKRPRLYL